MGFVRVMIIGNAAGKVPELLVIEVVKVSCIEKFSILLDSNSFVNLADTCF